MKKIKGAVNQYDVKQVAIGGGVSANSGIRTALKQMEQKGWKTFIPEFQYCTDNAAMIGIVGYLKYTQADFSDPSISAKARYIIGQKA